MRAVLRRPSACCVFFVAGLGACSKSSHLDGQRDAGVSTDSAWVTNAQAWFEDVAPRAGIVFEHESGHRERYYFPEIMGGGGALFDMDADGDLDVYLVQSGSLYEPRGASGANRLYENRGDGGFEEIAERSDASDCGYGMGVAAGDYDGDGDPDLYVTNVGANVLLRNDGAGIFTDVTEEAGAADPGWGVSATFSDLDADGDLDLFIANYVNWSMELERDCANALGESDYCLPTNYKAPGRDTLLRNNGDGTFTDVSEAAGLHTAFGYGLGVVCSDFDGDGRTDIFVANDTVFDQLWINQGDLSFYDDALLRGCAVDEDGIAKAGMGVMGLDYDDDGDRDLMVVNLERQSDSFYENRDGFFYDRTVEVGLGVASRKYTRFGIGFQDFDNDSWLDLYVANGRVIASASPLTDDRYAEPNLLFAGGPDRKLVEVSPQGGTIAEHVYTSRAAAFGDVDGDGGMDVLVVNRDGPAQLLRNVRRERGNWIMFRVREESRGAALGAVVTVRLGERTLTRDVLSGYSYGSASDPSVHIGLGERERVDEVRVDWVGGESESFGELEGGRVHDLVRGNGV